RRAYLKGWSAADFTRAHEGRVYCRCRDSSRPPTLATMRTSVVTESLGCRKVKIPDLRAMSGTDDGHTLGAPVSDRQRDGAPARVPARLRMEPRAGARSHALALQGVSGRWPLAVADRTGHGVGTGKHSRRWHPAAAARRPAAQQIRARR